MEALYLTKTVPARNEKFEITNWSPAGRVLIPPRSMLCAEEREDLGGKTLVTLLNGKDFIVEEKPGDFLDCILEEVSYERC